ncbi:MAG: phospholipid transport system substrate-binding protein [Gammaproteobacteria bacterium]|jgi:phospholipid transport system substrate-binding protein
MAAPSANDAQAVVEELHATLLNAMRNAQSLGYEGRVQILNPVLAESFDFTTIGRIVTGNSSEQWNALDDGQRSRFLDVFRRLSAATYASNFDGYSGEFFETLAVEEKRGRVLVKTVIVKSDGDKVTLDYLVRENNGMWRIVNVIASGVSDLSLKRADYTAVIKSEGLDSLIGKLTDKVANYTSSGR